MKGRNRFPGLFQITEPSQANGLVPLNRPNQCVFGGKLCKWFSQLIERFLQGSNLVLTTLRITKSLITESTGQLKLNVNLQGHQSSLGQTVIITCFVAGSRYHFAQRGIDFF